MRAFEQWLAVAWLALCLVGAAQAQQNNTREQEQLRRLRQQLQQLQQEHGSAQQEAQRANAERSKLADELKAVQAAASKLQLSAAARSRALAAVQTELETLKSERDALQSEQGKSKDTQAETMARLVRMTTELNGTRARLLSTETAFDQVRHERTAVAERLKQCSAHNVELLRVGQELLGRYGNFGLGETLAAREPFLQFKRVQLENLAQDYRSRLDEQRFTAPASATPPSTAVPTPAPAPAAVPLP